MDFWRAVAILEKRKWLILLSVVSTMALTFAASALVGSKWVATVSFAVRPATNLMANPGEAQNAEVRLDREQLAVYKLLAKSRAVVVPALDAIHATQIPPDLLKSITVEATGPTILLEATDSSPSRVQAFTNALAESFVQQNGELYSRQAKEVVRFLENQLASLDNKLASSRSRYDRYRLQHGIPTTLNDSIAPALERLQDARRRRDDVMERLVDARARLAQKQQEINLLPKFVPLDRPGTISPLVQQLQAQLAQAEAQLTALRARYTDEKIEVRQALAVKEALDKRLRAELAKQPESIIQGPNPELEAARRAARELKQEVESEQAQVKQLDSALAQAQVQIKSFSGLDSSLGSLGNELSTLTETRGSLQARLQAARMAADAAARQNPVTILDRVSEYNPPVNSTAGRTLKLVLIAALCALMCTCGAILALDSVDRRLRNVNEAGKMLPAPVVAAIPQPLGQVGPSALARVTEQHPLALHSEAYRFLAVRMLGMPSEQVRSLLLLCAKGGQGSTSAVTNLGITLAQAGRRVVLVDANIRSPRLHDIFELPNQVGFTSAILQPEHYALEDVLHPTEIPNLYVITSGPPCANPWELFRSPHLHELSRKLRDRADHVLYDSASALAFTDALNLGSIVDGAYLCVRAMEPTTGAEQSLVDLLLEAKVPVLGSIVNDLPPAVLDSYQNYQRIYPGTPVAAGGSKLALAPPPAPYVRVVADDTAPNGNGHHGPNGHNGGNGYIVSTGSNGHRDNGFHAGNGTGDHAGVGDTDEPGCEPRAMGSEL